jgi:hypothetical protein
MARMVRKGTAGVAFDQPLEVEKIISVYGGF